MFKKFIVAFAFALITIGYINVKADNTDFKTRINNYQVTFPYSSTVNYTASDIQNLIYNADSNIVGFGLRKPKNTGNYVWNVYPIYKTQYNTYNGVYLCNLKDFDNTKDNLLGMASTNYINTKYYSISRSSGGVYSVSYQGSYDISFTTNTKVVNNNRNYFPFERQDLSDWYIYVKEGYDIFYDNVKQNIPSYDIGDTRRDNVITNFEHNLITVSSATENLAFRNHTYFLKIAETYEIGQNQVNDHMFTINYSIPSNTALLGYMNNYFGNFDVITTNILKMGIAQAKNDGVNARYNSNGQKKDSSTYTDITIEIDADYCVEQGIATIQVEQNLDDYPRISYVVTDYYFSLDGIADLHYVPQGILGKMIQYYGDIQKALFATAYINVNYVTCYSYDPEHNLVYNPINVYYPDQIYSNGVVAERRSFKTKTDVTQEEIKHNQDIESNESVVGDEDAPFVNPSENTMQNLYNNSIQDSYNNITNNYYYDNGLTENILDYYRGFSDGATDENIDSALGYVKGTLGSLTHIPLLLSYCFNAFFPVEIIRLFQALFIIFVVFMIIRIIKHLFTH